MAHSPAGSLVLVVRRTIQAPPERLFAAWTQPEQLLCWWAPPGVTCLEASVDLRVGGRYRIANVLPDGSLVTLVGEYQVIEPPHRLSYTWQVAGTSGTAERVTVRFEPRGGATEVILLHESIPDEHLRDQHQRGWEGCLDGLAKHVQTPVAPGGVT